MFTKSPPAPHTPRASKKKFFLSLSSQGETIFKKKDLRLLFVLIFFIIERRSEFGNQKD